MEREVEISGTTFIVNAFSAEHATENLDDILRRVIVKNAETEFKKRPFFGTSEAKSNKT